MILFFDTETTGLPAGYAKPSTDTDNWPRLVSIAWQVFTPSGAYVSEGNYLIQPEGFTIPEAAVKVHGITTTMANEQGKPLAEVMNVLSRTQEACTHLVCHNVTFDTKVVNAEFIRLGLEPLLPEKGSNTYCTMKAQETLDFCQISFNGNFKYPSLQELHQKCFGRKFSSAHTATADVDALQRCYWEMIRRGILPELTEKKRYSFDALPSEIDGIVIDRDNPEFQQALDIVMNTRENLYLTGKAGAGKTFFLKCLRAVCKKNMIVVAPTGIAAVNAGGVTIHSQFMIGPPYVFPPTDPRFRTTGEGNHYETFQYNAETIELIRNMDLLVIDEISMVRADLLDMIDSILQIRRRNRGVPFGGVQLLMIGDAFQLPPITKGDHKVILAPHYPGYFFFNSRALTGVKPLSVELQKIYRQSGDSDFIEILNNVREGEVSADQLATINDRFVVEVDDMDGFIEVCTTNAAANAKNDHEFGQLTTPIEVFEGEITGEFPLNSLPIPLQIQFRVGAQVMFAKNDTSHDIYNGLIGTITAIEKGDEPEITVLLDDGSSRIATPAQWNNYANITDADTGRIKAEIIGSYKQIPLKLAWAITVHKSQGMTFQKMIATVAGAWDPGQVYVALSRCTSLEGLVLREEIPMHAISAHPAVTEFSELVDYTTTASLLSKRTEAQGLYHRAWKAGLAFDLETAIRLVKQANSLDSHTGHPRYKRATQIIQKRVYRSGNEGKKIQELSSRLETEKALVTKLELTVAGHDQKIQETLEYVESKQRHFNDVKDALQAELLIANRLKKEALQENKRLKNRSLWQRIMNQY